jgi:hypothetical protein
VTGQIPILSLATFLFAQAAAAQGTSLAPSDPKRWDTSITIGWLGGNKEQLAGEWNDWYDTFATSVDVGRYWTPHFKTDLGATFTTDGDVYSQERFTVPGQSFPVFFSREHRFAIRALNLSAAYQFLENTWVHPFAGAGVQLAWERHRVETPFPTAFGRDGRGPFPVPLPPDASGTTFDPRPFVLGGAKFYVSEQGFIRTDLSAAVDGRGATRVWWRVGGGIDF